MTAIEFLASYRSLPAAEALSLPSAADAQRRLDALRAVEANLRGLGAESIGILAAFLEDGSVPDYARAAVEKIVADFDANVARAREI